MVFLLNNTILKEGLVIVKLTFFINRYFMIEYFRGYV